MRWLTLGLLLFAVRAHAQVDDPGEISSEPYRDCEGCQGWNDPYAYELAQLRLARPSYFWPHALILAGAATLAGGVTLADSSHPAVIIAPLAVGAVALTLGVVWRHHRSREREPYDQRIQDLEGAQAQLPRAQLAPVKPTDNDEIRALRRARPSIGLPIAVTSCGFGLLGAGAFALFVGIALHEPPVTAWGVGFTLAGAAVVAAGGTWWHHRRVQQRPYNEQIRTLRHLSVAPFVVRW